MQLSESSSVDKQHLRMAYRYPTGKEPTNQTRLPRITKKIGNTKNPVSSESAEDNSPLSFLRLPQIGKRFTGQSNAESCIHGEQTFKSYEITNVNMKYRTVGRATRHHITSSIERKKDSEEVTRYEETYARSKAFTVEGNRFDNHSVRGEMVKGTLGGENSLKKPIHLLRRRLRPGRAYQGSCSQILHDELLTFDQNMDLLRTCTERDNIVEVRDFSGKRIDVNKTGDSDITSYIAMFEVERRTTESFTDDNKKLLNCTAKEQTSSEEETNERVRGRFYEALDHHFFHYYRKTHPERRMAICEEIERTIVVNDLALSCFREHLSLQDVMNTWML